MKSEHVIQQEIQVGLSGEDSVVFRTNAGTFYQGKMIYSPEYKQKILINLRIVQGLPEGFSDLICVDKKGVAFIECKTLKGKAREAQERFMERMKALGHRAGIARSVEDAKEIVNGGEKGQP